MLAGWAVSGCNPAPVLPLALRLKCGKLSNETYKRQQTHSHIFCYLGVSKTPEENLSNPSSTRKSNGFIGKDACPIIDLNANNPGSPPHL